jgi:hypothetical protein
VREALTLAGREELIGLGEECLVRPAGGKGGQAQRGGARVPSGEHRAQGNSRKVTSGAQKKGVGGAKKEQSGAKKVSGGARKNDMQKPRSEKPTYKKGWAKPKKTTNKKKK